jgi:Flp pilus assembly pilin Flp
MMSKFASNLMALAADERGVTALEYGLVAGPVAAVVIVGSTAMFGTMLSGTAVIGALR